MGKLFIVGSILVMLSDLIMLGIMFALAIVRIGTETDYEYIWYCSKILTVKNIIKLNHNSEIFYNFSSSKDIVGLSTNYKNLLKLITKDGCVENYKQCGILDTIGNKLCIDEIFDCPINEMVVDFKSKINNYLYLGYDFGELNNSTYNYLLYYSNNDINGNATTMLIKSYDEPKFITNDNLYIDTDALKEIFPTFKIKEDNDNTENEAIMDIILKLSNLDILGDFGKLYSNLVEENTNKQIKSFLEYVQENYLDINKNNDIYYRHIGDNFYAKNYIGFKNEDDLNTFMNFDFNIYKRHYPNRLSAIFAICCICIYFPLICFNGTFYSKYKEKESYILFVGLNNLFYNFIIVLGFLIYSCVIYCEVYKNNEMKVLLKSIQSDELINNFINEFISKFENTKFILIMIGLLASSLLLNIVGITFMAVFENQDDDNDSNISFNRRK